MPSTTISAASPAADRRVARRRVGAVAVVAFLALLLAGAVRDAAGADPAVPASAPATQPQQPRTTPLVPSFPRERERDGGFGGGAPDSGGATPAPPSTDGGVIT
jgi:hypothetical protein